MVNQCDVLNCKNRTENTKFISFFRLPWDRSRQLVWLQLIGRMEWKDRGLEYLRNKRVCSKHFSHYDYRGQSFSKFRLTENADPSIFEEGVGYRAFQHVPLEATQPATDNTESIKSEPYVEHVTAEILSVYSGSPLNDPTGDHSDEEPELKKRKHSSEDNVIEQLPVTDSCEDIYDAKDICRLCLQEEDKTDLFSIFPKEDHEELISAVMKCIPVQVDEHDDRLPKHVCKACYKHLLDWFLFCEMCRSTDVTLKQFVNNVHVTDKDDSNMSFKKLKVLHDDNISNDCDKQLVKVPEESNMTGGSQRQTSHSVLQLPTQQNHCQVQVGAIPTCSVDSSDTILSMSTTETSSKPNSTSIATCFEPSNNSINSSSIKINSKRQKIKNNERLHKRTKSDSGLKCRKIRLSPKSNTKNNSVSKHTAYINVKNNECTHVSSVPETNMFVTVTDIKSNTVTNNIDYSLSNNTENERAVNIKNCKLTDDITCSVSNVTETNMATEEIDIEKVTKDTACLTSKTSNLVDNTNALNEANDIKTSTVKDTVAPH